MADTMQQIVVRVFFFALSGLFLYIVYSSLFPLQPLGDGRYGLNITHVPFTATACLLVTLGVWLYTIPARVLEVQDRAVLITGCDTGFGHALAVHLDRLGFKVFAGCLFKGGEGERKLKLECSDRLTTLQLDITDQQQVDNALKDVSGSLHGHGLWGLVNNAGTLCLAEFELTPLSTIENVMNVNCIGHMRVTKAFLPLIRQSRGRIVNVSSVAGRVTHGLHCVYSAAKGGMELFSDGLRMEMAQWGVKVSIIDPAGYSTEMFSKASLESMVHMVEREASSEVKADYGDKYFKTYQKSILSIPNLVPKYISDDLSPVIDAMTNALLSTNPKARYSMGKGYWIVYFVRWFLPTAMGDKLIFKTFAPRMELPAGVLRMKGRSA
ncbi:retinol dehydrogenase 16-like [Ptychodera flava]|uniref:retinol dehydrogenase 16-like n=1 Tax=Ptychodera flava TaxID=63121 RepID=UPI003969EE14